VVSGVAALKRGDRLADWSRDWVERWKTEHWPEGAKTMADVVRMHAQLNPELERAQVEEGAPTGSYFYVHLIETMSDQAVPVPREIFDGGHDARWAPVFDDSHAHYEQAF
jgi:hypothetical protein